MVHVSFLGLKITIHPARKAQLPLLLTKKVIIPAKYSDFANVFLKQSAKVFPEQTGINEHAFKLEEGKQPSYRPICSLGPVELKILKIYIETTLANNFIKASKSSAGARIIFVRKPDNSLCLFVDYQGLNNLTIKIGISCRWLASL